MAADHYCYEDSDVLKNLLDIRDPEILQRYEHLLTAEMAQPALDFAKADPNPSFETLASIHYLLFGELYDWAGKPRTVGMSRNGVPFMDPPIDGAAVTSSVISPFQAAAPDATDEQFATLLGEVWSKLNACHPFRDGNGRATQLFVTALAHRHGRDINWSAVSRMMDNVAGMASQRGNHAGFIAIVKGAVRSFDPEQPSGFWRQEGR